MLLKTNLHFQELSQLVAKIPDAILQLSGTMNEHNVCDIVLSEFWPLAVSDTMVVRTDEGKHVRARSIINAMIRDSLKGQRFLDFGCGEGHVAVAAAKTASMSVGYDIVKSEEWQRLDKGIGLLTTDLNIVKANAPYDCILLYDVIDHIMTRESAVAALQLIHSVSTPSTRIYVRCHPYIARHGTHLYRTLNKAYAHLLLPSEVLNQYQSEPTRQILRPQAEYAGLFEAAQLKQKTQNIISKQLDDIFMQDDIVMMFKRIVNADREWQRQALAFEFIDYILHI